jgi:hypothetical protein
MQCRDSYVKGFFETWLLLNPIKLSSELSACLFELQLNDKQLELVRFEKRLELDDWWNSKMLFGNRLFG